MRPSSRALPVSFLGIEVAVWVMEATRDGEVEASRGGAWMGLGWYNGGIDIPGGYSARKGCRVGLAVASC